MTNLEAFRWLNEPSAWSFGDDGLAFTTEAQTDFWQRTHYGFRRDDGHAFVLEVENDLTLEAEVDTSPTAQYDQCGLLCRIDSDTWAKCSVEYEEPGHRRLGSVVTRGGFSDWATQDVNSLTRVRYRLDRRGADLRFSWRTDADWHQMRIAHLEGGPALVGVYGCSPVGHGFACRVRGLEVGACVWEAE